MNVSVLIPARDEVGTLAEVVEKVGRAFAACDLAGELVLVNDGSTDGTGQLADELAARTPFLRVLHHRRPLGLTAALRTGFRAVRGDVIVFLPADLESDPETDIPLLLDKLTEGYDVVAGWRQGRRERKVFASGVYNRVSRLLFGLRVHDMNWIKAFRREVITSLPPLRSDWHRFLLHLAAAQGFRIGEVPTTYHPRRAGRSKFGLMRLPVSLLDVLVVWFLITFSRQPMRFFGGLGLVCLGISGMTYFYLLALWLLRQTQQRPIFTAAGVLALAGLVLFLVGFLAELVVSQGERMEALEREWQHLKGDKEGRS